ncbi:MAG: DNA polymerase III subunit delta' [Deltaproteobacteria bacterium]|nr:DNA polymerase III subunit delta' [Deltaproteobacteria bacterium]
MPGFESIIDQERPIRILTTFLQKGTIPHALLFTGIEGVGKERAAAAFAMACNCTRDGAGYIPGGENTRKTNRRSAPIRPMPTIPCGDCKSCRKIQAHNHPDIIRVKPSGPFIKIDQIRTLCQALTMRPYEAKIRVVIISDAQAMNPAAGNALLKVLEEPPARTHLILVTEHPSDLLPTIISRCQHIRFKPISQKNIESVLVRLHGLNPPDAQIIAGMAGGSLSRALGMYGSNWINRRNWLINELDNLSAGPSNRLLAFGEQLSKNKDMLPAALEVMKSWIRDLVIEKVYPDKIINRDLTATIRQTSRKMSMDLLFEKIETIQSTQHAIKAGTNLRLAMEAMVLKLAQV